MKFNLDPRGWAIKIKKNWSARSRTIFLRVFGILVFLGLIGYLIYQIIEAWDQIQNYPWQIKPVYFFLGFLIYSFNLSLTIFVWSRIMKRLAGDVSYWTHFRFYVLTILANRLPTPIPSAGARAAAYSTIGIDQSLTLGAFAFEGSVTMLSGMIVGLLFLPFSQADNLLVQTGWGLMVMVPLLVVVLWPGKLMALINYANRWLKRPEITVSVSSKDTLVWVALFMVIWISTGLANLVVTRAIFPVSFELLPAFIGIIALTGVIGWISQFFFLLPSMAVRQVAAAYFLSAFLAWPVALASSILSRMIGMVYELIWAVTIGLIWPLIFRKKENKHE